MRPVTIGFLLTLGSGGYIIFTQPHLWFFALCTSVWAGLAMVQADVISMLVKKIQHKDALLELSKLMLEKARVVLESVAVNKKEDA